MQSQIPLYTPDVEYALLQAQQTDAWQNRLAYLAQAIQLDSRIIYDEATRQLTSELTGLSADEALPWLHDPMQTRALIEHLSQSTPSQPSRLPVGLWVILITGIISVLMVFNTDTTPIALMQELRSTTPQGTEHVRAGVHYHVLIPDGKAPAGGWHTVFVLPERGASSQSMYDLFAQQTHQNHLALIIAEHRLYANSDTSAALPSLKTIVTDAGHNYRLNTSNMALVGIAEGGETLSQYARQHPEQTAMLITFGATFLHPPGDTYKTAYIYGKDDPLLQNRTDNDEPSFSNPSQWKDSLNYIVIEDVGRIPQRAQVSVFMELIKNLYEIP